MTQVPLQAQLALSRGGILRKAFLVSGAVVALALLLLTWWVTDASELRFEGFSEFGTIAFAYFLLLLVSAFFVATLAWKFYYAPRGRAFKEGLLCVDVLGGKGQLILWHPGETYIFLKNKRVAAVGDGNGGTETVCQFLGEEAIGPISLKTELLPWPDKQVFTREAQPVEISLGIWWRVESPQLYAFKIASEIHGEGTKVPQDFRATSRLASENVVIDPHRPAANWLHVWVESAVRSYVSRLSLADVVSVQASKWLRLPGDAEGQATTTDGNFDQMQASILKDVKDKAQEYGIALEKVSVQGIRLPQNLQTVIDETRQAFLLPIKSEQEANARYIALSRTLEASRDVLGLESFQLNELLKNFKGSDFGYFPQFVQGLFGMVDQKTAAVAAGHVTSTSLQPASVPPVAPTKSPAATDKQT